MTTTNVFQGLQGDKSTSKVLRAPGGGSSITIGMFGGEEEPKPAQAASAEPGEETEAAAQQQGCESSEQGQGDSKPAEEQAAAGVATPKNQDRNPITGFGMGDTGPASNKKHFSSAGSYNPITGEENPVQEKPKRQPPGGASSGIF